MMDGRTYVPRSKWAGGRRISHALKLIGRAQAGTADGTVRQAIGGPPFSNTYVHQHELETSMRYTPV